MKNLPQSAKRLIVWIAAVASTVFVTALLEWRTGNPLELVIWILLAAGAGTVKVRFPAVESSYSFGYIIVLGGMSMLPFSDVVLISLVTALVQCYSHISKRPMAVQVLFNLCNYAISAAASWCAFHVLAYLAPGLSMPVRFTFGAGVFFLLNTGLVSWILAILGRCTLMEVWEKSHLLIFPFYLMGAACASVVAWQERVSAWVMLAMCPLLYAIYVSMRGWLRKVTVSSQ